MLTIERLDAAIAKVTAIETENTDLKAQVATLQGQVSSMPAADVLAKADQLVTAVIGPDTQPMPTAN